MKYHPLLEQQLERFIQIRNKDNERFLRQISLAYEEFENITPKLCSTQRQYNIDYQLLQLQNDIEDNETLENNIKILCRRGANLLQASSLGLWHLDREQMIIECECEYLPKTNDFIADKYEIINNFKSFNHRLLNSRYYWHEPEPENHQWILDIPITIEHYALGFLRARFNPPHPNPKDLCATLGATLGDMARFIYLKYRRRLALEELEESEHHFKALAESTGAAIFAFRETIIYANKATEELIGLDQSSQRLLPISIILGMDFAKRFNAHTLSNKRKAVGVEVEFARPSGEIRWAFINVAQTHYAGQHTWLASAFDITERKRAEIQLRFQAYHDNLTSLPNRIEACQALDNCLTKASRDRYYRFAAAIIEIQGLNELSEQLGFNSSDHYLIDIALKLKTFANITDCVAKVSHNSFVFIRENISNKEEMLKACEQLLSHIKTPLNIDGLLVSQPINIGITYCDRLYQSGEEVLRHCSIAAQQQTYENPSAITFFNESLLQKIEQQKSVASKLRQAISRGELDIHLVPYRNTQNQTLCIFEALIHWKESHPCRLGEEHFRLLNRDSALTLEIAHWLINAADDQSVPFEPSTERAVWVDLSSVSLRDLQDFFKLLPTRSRENRTYQLIIQVPGDLIKLAADRAHNREFTQYLELLQNSYCALAIDLSDLNINQLEQLPDSGVTYAKLNSPAANGRRTGNALMQMALKYCAMLGIQVFTESDISDRQTSLANRIPTAPLSDQLKNTLNNSRHY